MLQTPMDVIGKVVEGKVVVNIIGTNICTDVLREILDRKLQSPHLAGK